MSTTIDQKVVEMRFDNRQFEQNVSQTMSSIDKLNNSLSFKGSEKGFNNITDASRQTSKSLEDFEYTSYKTGFSWSDVLRKISSVVEWNIANRAVNLLSGSLKNLADQMLGVTAAKAGFNEYELKMGSIQTIMASTGESLETVNGYLNELNEYSDRTIYSFSDMTSNIGKFTNAGVNLKDSVAAIQGIANVAAVSGANANEASRAMYNFSQALSSGYVKLIDWKSIENANMATVEFKEQLIETAVELGTVTKAADGTYKTLEGNTFSATRNFNEVLQDQWMTSEVLTKTLGRYADETTEIGKKAFAAAQDVKTFSQMMDTLREAAQSGWAQTWELIFGDFEEGKSLWTGINEVLSGVVEGAANARNALLEDWKIAGGRDDLVESLYNVFEALAAVIKPIKQALTDIFPPVTARALLEFTKNLKEFTEGLKISSDTSYKLRKIFGGLFAVVDIAVEIFVEATKAVGSLFGETKELTGGVLGIAASFSEVLIRVSEFIKDSNIIGNAFQFVAKGIKLVLRLTTRVINAIRGMFDSGPLEIFGDILGSIIVIFDELLNSTGDFGNDIKYTFEHIGASIKNSALFGALMTLWDTIKSIAKGIATTIGGAFKGVADAFANGDLTNGFELLNTILKGGLLLGLAEFIRRLIGLFESDSIFGPIKDLLDNVADTFESFTNKLNATAIKTIATAILALAIALVALSFIDKEKLATSLAAITIALTEMVVAVSALAKIKDIKTARKAVGALMTLSAALVVLAIALRIIGGMDEDALTRSILALTGILLNLVGAELILSRFAGDKSMLRGSASIVILAAAILLIAVPLRIIGDMDAASLERSVLALAGILATLIGVQLVLSKFAGSGKKMLQGASSIVILASAMLLIAIPLRIIGAMGADELERSALTLVGILTSLIGVQLILSKLAGAGKKMLQGAGSIAIMATAINLIVPALVIIGLMKTEQLIQGAIGIAAILSYLVVAQRYLSKFAGSGKKMLQGAASIAIMAAAINLIIPVLLAVGLMGTPDLIQGAIGISIILASLIGVQIVLSKFAGSGKKMLQGAASIAIMAAAINLVLPTLKVLGGMRSDKFIQGAIGLTIALGELVAAQILLSRLGGNGIKMLQGAASIAILAGAILVLAPALHILGSLEIGELGIALLAIAGALAILGIAAAILAPYAGAMLTMAGALALIGAAAFLAASALVVLGIALGAIAAGLIQLVGAIAIMAGSIAIIETVIAGLVSALIAGIIVGIGKGIIAICDMISELIPAIAKILTVLLLTLVDVLLDCAPPIINAILSITLDLLKALVEFTPLIVEALVDLLIGIIQKIAERLPDVISVLVDLIFALIKGTIDALAGMDQTELLDALKSVAMLEAMMLMLASMVFLMPAATAGVFGLALVCGELALVFAAFGKLSQIDGLANLIADGGDFLQVVGTAIGQFIGGIVGGIAKGVSSALPQIATDLSNFMVAIQPFIAGASAIDTSLLAGIATLAGAILLISGASIIESISSWLIGDSSTKKFAEDLIHLGTGLAGFSKVVANVNVDAVSKAADAAKKLADMTNCIPNSGGIVSWFAGDNSISKWGAELIVLGAALWGFSKEVANVDSDAVGKAADAAQKLADMSNSVPNSGGIASWFAGDNSVAKWGVRLVILGNCLSSFSKAVSGINVDTVTAAAEAAKPLAELTNNVPNSGGMVSWFTGENSVAAWGEELISLGESLCGFASSVKDIDKTSLEPAIAAASALVELTKTFPNHGGMVSWFAGDNSVAAWGEELASLGTSLSSFSASVKDVDKTKVEPAIDALHYLITQIGDVDEISYKSLAKLTKSLPELGAGIAYFSLYAKEIDAVSVESGAQAINKLVEATSNMNTDDGFWSNILGGTDYSGFAKSLTDLGMGLYSFSAHTENVNLTTIETGAKALTILANATNSLPADDGFWNKLCGGTDYSGFANSLSKLGFGISMFSSWVANVNATSVETGAKALSTVANVTKSLPAEDGLWAKICGGTDYSGFSKSMLMLGAGISGFSAMVANVDSTNVETGAKAISIIAQTTKSLPSDEGFWSKLLGSYSGFATSLSQLGKGVNEFSKNVGDIDVDKVKAGVTAVKAVSGLASSVGDTSSLVTFGGHLTTFGGKVRDYFSNIGRVNEKSIGASKSAIAAIKNIGTLNSESIRSAGDAISKVATALTNLSKVPKRVGENFNKIIKDLGKETADKLLSGFEDLDDDMRKKAESAIKAFVEAIEDKLSDVSDAGESIAKETASAIENKANLFNAAAANLVKGFANGISSNTWRAEAKSRAMARAAAEAAEKELDEHSPSKVGYGIGDYFGIAFVNAISDNVSGAYDASSEMAKSARSGLGETIAKLGRTLDGDMDMQPTIRPVLDLSDVRSGASAISSMFGSGSSIGVLANVGSISSAMNRNGQNGGNEDVVSAIKELRSEVGKLKSESITINGLTYDDGSNLAEAVKDIIRAARIERRV